MIQLIPINNLKGTLSNSLIASASRAFKAIIALAICIALGTTSSAHPGSGIVIDKKGNIYFTDTGKGVWKIAVNGAITYLPAPEFHWMTLDGDGYFANVPASFGQHFEKIVLENNKFSLIMCSDFPLVMGVDGIIYYANTRTDGAKVVGRSASGKEATLANDRIFSFVSGIAIGPDGLLYITEASDPNANTIRKINMDGTMSVIATYEGKNGNPPLETNPSYCRGLAVDSTGNIYVAATGSRCVVRITPRGEVTTILKTTGAWAPTGVAVFHGEVFVLEWHDAPAEKLEVRSAWIPRVRKIGRDGKVSTVASVSRS